MNANYFTKAQPGSQFDLFRLSSSKQIVDVCPNTLRQYHSDGLPFYRCGKAVFISKAELELFIRSKKCLPPSTVSTKGGGNE
jgi:NurA-like 5'-3' nuclease